jgi:hypothetical protein
MSSPEALQVFPSHARSNQRHKHKGHSGTVDALRAPRGMSPRGHNYSSNKSLSLGNTAPFEALSSLAAWVEW